MKRLKLKMRVLYIEKFEFTTDSIHAENIKTEVTIEFKFINVNLKLID